MKPVYSIIGIAVIAVIASIVILSGSNIDTMVAVIDPVEKIIPKDIIHEWPESVGNSPDNPIMFPYTLDQYYMRSDSGIGGCEMTINGLRQEPNRPISNENVRTTYSLDVTISPIKGAKSCEINGARQIWNCLDSLKNRRPICDGPPFIDAGDTLVGIKINTAEGIDRFIEPPDFYGFLFKYPHILDGFNYAKDVDLDNIESLAWKFNGEESHTWELEAGLNTKSTYERRILFDTVSTVSINYPTSIELMFIDVTELETELERNPEHNNKVNLLYKGIHYSKYFDIEYIDP